MSRSGWIVTPPTRPPARAKWRAKGAFMSWSANQTKTHLGVSGARLPKPFGVACAQAAPAVLGPATGTGGGCSTNQTAQSQLAPNNTIIQPWDDVIPVAQTAA